MLGKLVLAIVCVYLIGNVGHAVYLQKTVYGDGVYYYSWLHSLILEQNFNFESEYNRLGGNQPYLSPHLPANKYSIGPALFWTPNYVLIHRIIRGDGYTLPYQITVSLTSLCAALFGLIILTRLVKSKELNTSIALLLIAFGTNLFFYGSVDTVNSHAITFFWASVYIVLLTLKSIPWFAVGVVLGALSATRLQDILYILLLLPYVKTINYKSFCTGVLLSFAPQLIAWYLLYGSLINPYLQGGEGFNVFVPHILGVLFEKENGLFLWTPVVLLGILGLWSKRKKYVLYLTVIFLQIYLVSTWSTWWQGASYSGRMFVSILPLIYVGLVEKVEWFAKVISSEKSLFLLALSLCGVNSLMIISFLLVH